MQKTNNNSNSFFLFVTLLTLQVVFGNCVYGQVLRPGDDTGAIRPPYSEEMDQSNITERLGDLLPLDLEFMDHTGAKVKLADFFSGDLPVLLTPVYYRCPQLCTLVLNGMVDSLDKIELQPGRDYRILSFTLDRTEEK